MALPRYQTPSSYLGKTGPLKPAAFINRSAALPTLPTRVSSTPTTAPVTTPQQSVEDWIREQASRYIQSQIEAVNAQRQAYLSDLAQQRELEMQRGQALSQALQGLNIPGRIQQIYGDASANIGGLAQAFSGSLRDTATADAAQETRMVSGTGQEGAVANNGAALGDVLYGAQGYIPARNASETGAAFASQAALEPGFAQRIGQVKGADLYSQGLEGLKQFTDQILQIEAQRPQIEDDLYQRYQQAQEASQPKLGHYQLADGREQFYDEATGQPVGKPQGMKTASAGGKNTIRTLANGQLQAFDAQGRPVGKPYGPVRESSSSQKLQARSLANGQIQWFDPTTGQPVGSPQGPKRATTKKGPGGQTYNLQLKTLADGSQQWFDPRTGKPVGPKISPPKQKPAKRADGVTSTQLRKYKAQAYTAAKAWHDQGEMDENGKHFTWKQFLGYMVNSGGIPYDVAVSQLGRFSPQARKAIKSKINARTGQPAQPPTRPASNVTQATGVNGYNPKTGVVALPASWSGTHVTDGLGWGTKTAHDFMAPAGSPVVSPVSGTIVYFRPDGAQGGGSMLIRGDDGYEYWLGHIQDGMSGGRIEVGQSIARVAFQNVSAPHVHIDRRLIGGRS